MRVYRQRSYNRVHPLLKVLLIIVLVVGISFSLAWVWHTTEQSVVAAEGPETPLADPDNPTDLSQASVEEPVTGSADHIPPQEELQEDAEDPPADAPVVFSGAVPASEPVDASYFDDAIFIGDSITTGIPLYHMADNADVVAMNGVNTDNILEKPWIDIGEEERVTILDACKTYGEKSKVYILLGGNSIGYEKSTFIRGYKEFLAEVKALYPGAVIYLQSMTPVVEGYVNEFDPTLDNEKIDEYNLEIMALAKEESVYYLDIASALKDENGALPHEASPVDGLHFSAEYYVKWFDYLKTHTVEGRS